MTASHVSIIQLADIVEEYLTQERYDYISIAARLRQVRGSKSVLETCEALAKEVERRAPDR
jgi:hypothetical protein